MKIVSKANKMVICLTLLFLVDLVTIFKDYASVSILKVLIYLLCFVFLLSMSKRSEICRCYETKTFWNLTLVYLVMLFLRLCFDFLLPWKGFFMYLSPLTVLFFYFMTMVMPRFFLKRISEELDYDKFSMVSGICLCLYLFYSYNEIISGSVEAATTSGRYAGVGGIDIIMYGHLGLSLVLIALYVLLYSDKRIKALSLMFLTVGFSAMILSGSRSPFVGLLICLIILLRSKYSKWYIAIIVIGFIVVFFKIFSVEIVRFNEYLNSIGINSFGRVINTFIGEEVAISETSSGRDDIWNMGWHVFLQNPIFGVSYLLPDDSYVHNIFIEQFMALGVVGGAVFVIINLKAILLGWKTVVISPKTALVYTLFVQYLVLGCFSRTIIALGAYWLFMFMTIKNYERIKQL